MRRSVKLAHRTFLLARAVTHFRFGETKRSGGKGAASKDAVHGKRSFLMNNIIWIIGAIVIVLAILGF